MVSHPELELYSSKRQLPSTTDKSGRAPTPAVGPPTTVMTLQYLYNHRDKYGIKENYLWKKGAHIPRLPFVADVLSALINERAKSEMPCLYQMAEVSAAFRSHRGRFKLWVDRQGTHNNYSADRVAVLANRAGIPAVLCRR